MRIFKVMKAWWNGGGGGAKPFQHKVSVPFITLEKNAVICFDEHGRFKGVLRPGNTRDEVKGSAAIGSTELVSARETNRRLNRLNQTLSVGMGRLYTEIEQLRSERRCLRGKLERHMGYCEAHKKTIARLDQKLREKEKNIGQ